MHDHAFDDQLRDLLPRLRRFALWLTHDIANADDLVQSTLERALSRWGSRREEEALRSWLFAILYRQFLDARRRTKRYASLLDHFNQEDGEVQPSVEREVVAQSVLQSLARLPPEQQNLLLWISVEGLSYREVAQILDVPIGTVMSRLSRARQALRRLSDGETMAPVMRLLK